jgi:hypothetical protein
MSSTQILIVIPTFKQDRGRAVKTDLSHSQRTPYDLHAVCGKVCQSVIMTHNTGSACDTLACLGPRFSQTIRIAMSAGETPEMREA